LIAWLNAIAPQAEEIIFLGDLFDFWFEYKHAVPKGFVRLLGKLAELSDAGLPITVFAGNHDMWYRDYFPTELGIRVVQHHTTREWFGKSYYLHHGDGKGPGDKGYKWMKAVMRNRTARWLFRWLHPDLGIGLASGLSHSSRAAQVKKPDPDKGEREYLFQYVRKKVEQGTDFDYFVFGHRHRASYQAFGSRTHLIVLGDWINDFSYLEIGSAGPALRTFSGDDAIWGDASKRMGPVAPQ
jgi:UDP-2,3-diacylglucosamine hydrolase